MPRIAGRGWRKISAANALTVSPGGRGGKRRRVGQFILLYEHDIDGPTCAEFLRALLRRVRGPVTLVWDGLAVHRSPAVKAVLARNKRMEVHRLPSYAPEPNPVEPMWGSAKGVKHSGTVPENRDDLEIATALALEDIGRDQRLLRFFFNATPLAVPRVTTRVALLCSAQYGEEPWEQVNPLFVIDDESKDP